jgi:hypothetical protein
MPNYDPTMDQVRVVLGERSHEFSVDFMQEPNEVYVNIMHSEAVVVSQDDNKLFHAVYYRWARDHGVEEEHWIGSSHDAESVADLVLGWADRYEKAQAKLAAEMEAAFGGGE